jgi:hypothetical protein
MYNIVKTPTDKQKIVTVLDYLESKIDLIYNDKTGDLIEALLLKLFNYLAKIKNIRRREVYIILIAKKYNTSPEIALDILEDNGLFVALPVDKNLIKSIRQLL